MSTLSEQNKAIVLRFAKEAWGNVPLWDQVWDELVAEDIIWYFCGCSEPISGSKAKEFYATLYQSFPDIELVSVENAIAENDKVAFRSTIKGTHKGEFMGISPTGKSINASDLNLFRISEGKIVEWWYELNLLEVMNQIGVISDTISV
ncbi:ester cyclase [Scytonema hofmannii FACHB-248]|uniref:Ester cyclase n=1 Tax=Scytonema hofmannii FACHB-248 TaxID=1842502 RepID=A0ABR8H089_9CYAN|nr:MULTISPECIES: ester cyclase [Nostocales]MBD2608872.1 ester cyclase [Scytonema hofmannii FACHB-248]